MKPAIGIAAAALAAGTGLAMITVTPPGHDFGKVAVGIASLMSFDVTSTAGDSMGVAFTGPHASDFGATSPFVKCVNSSGNPTTSCRLIVTFQPAAAGVRTASMALANASGQRASVPLRGEGVKADCIPKVVFCNYAHLYSGTYSWQIVLMDADTRNTTDITVSVVKGVATCQGTVVETDARTGGNSGTISGPGLIAVEFGPDSNRALSFHIVAACPTVQRPDLASTPASLGNSASQDSYNQPATAIGMDLVGTSRYPAPETDPVNGVSGTVSVAWSLKRWCTAPSGCP